MNVFELIEAQQKGQEGSTVFMVGQQLKDICREDPACAQIVAEDLQQKGMGIADCEKKIKALADKIHREKKINNVGIDPGAAEDVIRKFYGLPDRMKETEVSPAAPATTAPSDDGLGLNLDDLLGI